jgi:hypothetical protein
MAKQIKKELPQVLVLKRKFIQRFPNGQMVALYHSENLNQFITVPLDNSQFSSTTESVIEQLNCISENDNVDTLMFDDLSELNINKECADIILTYISSKPEILESFVESDKKFLEILEQAVNIQSDIMESDNKQELIEQ